MRIFVTGASGYIGHAVARALSRAGHEVLGLVRSEPKARMLRRGEIRPVMGDLNQPAGWMKAAEACTVLVHCGADSEKGVAGPDRLAVGALLDVSGRGPGPKSLVYTSGVWVYGSPGSRLVDETEPVRPVAVVQWRPDHERMVLQSAHARGVVLRPACVYGGAGGMASEWFASVARTGRVRVVGDGTNHWSMVHLDDLAEGYRMVVESEVSGLLNFSDRSRDTVGEMAQAVASAAGLPGAVDFVPATEAAAQEGARVEALCLDQHIDSRRAVRLLSWQPKHGGFVDSAPTCFEAWKAHQL